jgi:dipeptide/tripeptide permease
MVKELVEPERLPSAVASPDPQVPIPKQIRYIIGNEGCERFSFYGMRNILTVFLVSSLLFTCLNPNAHAARKTFFTRS